MFQFAAHSSRQMQTSVARSARNRSPASAAIRNQSNHRSPGRRAAGKEGEKREKRRREEKILNNNANTCCRRVVVAECGYVTHCMAS